MKNSPQIEILSGETPDAQPFKNMTHGIKVVFGTPEIKPIETPHTAIKVKTRAGEFAKCYVKTPTGIEQWYLKDGGDKWQLAVKIGENKRP